jgi:hypothetical protein
LLPAQVASSSPFENLTPTVAVVETLVTAIAEDLGDQARQRFEQFGGVVDHWIRPWPASDSTAEGAGDRRPASTRPGNHPPA